MKILKIFTAFSGYDSQMLAIQRAGIDAELVGWSEIDKNAILAHNTLFPKYKDRNFGDIAEIDWSEVPDFDLFTYSSPCQDFSIGGYGAGGAKGTRTRSSLLWECERAIKAKKPRYLLFENVPALLQKKHVQVFERWCKTLERLGYSNFYEVLDSANYGVPQNRRRLYMVSVLGGSFAFPEGSLTTRKAAELFDKDVDPSFVVTDRALLSKIRQFVNIKKGRFVVSFSRDDSGNVVSYHTKELSNTIIASQFPNTMQYFCTDGKLHKPTPSECFRLMGLKESEIKALKRSGISDNNLHKLAGNSIVVDVLTAIFGELFKVKKSGPQSLKGWAKASARRKALEKHNQQKRKSLCKK